MARRWISVGVVMFMPASSASSSGNTPSAANPPAELSALLLDEEAVDAPLAAAAAAAAAAVTEADAGGSLRERTEVMERAGARAAGPKTPTGSEAGVA